MRRAAVLVLGTAEWNAAIATNQHYAARALAEEFTVTFVESLGLRKPRLDRGDLSRVRQRLSRATKEAATSVRPRPDGLDVISPLVVPLHTRWTRGLNTGLLMRTVHQWLNHRGPRLLWAYTPVTYGLESYADAAIYHLVDLLHTYPRIDSAAVLRNERLLRGSVHLAIASSAPVAEHLSGSGFGRVELLPNVAEVEPFIDAAGAHSRVLEPPVAVFAGNITSTKIDLSLIEAVTNLAAGNIRVRLIGPVGLGGGVSPVWRKRLEMSGAEIVAPMPLAQLAREYALASVALIPYEINSYTRGVNPLKTYEYLAAGLPIVSSPIPAVESVPNAIWVETSPLSFAARVIELAKEDDRQHRAARQTLAKANSWLERGATLRGLAREALLSSH